MDSIGRIAVIVPHISSNTDTSFIDVIHTMASESGYDTIVISGVINYVDQQLENIYSRGQTNIYDLIINGDFDGFIFEADLFCSEKLRRSILGLLQKKNRPCVVVNYDQPYFPVVSADESIPLHLSTQHLISEHGCRKIYCIGGTKGDAPSEKRINGFRMAMDEAGLPYDESCIFYGNYWRDVPHRAALDIAEGRLDMPDGIVCGSDIMAVELSRTLINNGIKIPEDIKITGCDGSIISQTERISVTTVADQERINGRLAVSRLLEMLGKEVSGADMTPELVIGESCGCSQNRCMKKSSARSDIREYAGTVFEILEHRKTSSHGEIIRRMSECKDIFDVAGTFLGCCYMIPTGIKAELCLCEDWCRDMKDPSVYRRGGLPEKMLLAIEACSEGGEKMKEFMTKDIFPSLSKPHSPRLTVVTSLHYKGQILGYVGFTYKKAVYIILDEFYMSWCDAVGSGLNTIWNRMYKDYVNKRIESLSEFAPVLGIYNKRGLISRLMGIMSENSSAALTLTLLSYTKENKVRYCIPPINSIVNAIRLSSSDAVLASIDDDIVAIAQPKGEKDVSENSFAAGIVQIVRRSYKGAVDIRQERIAVISRPVTSSDIFGIDEIICSMEDRLKGKIISLSTGTFSYKEQFIAMRENIYKHPETDWSIEALTRSIGVSKSHFHRIYKELFETSCKDDIITSRLKKAKWLLENTSLPISQIAEQCGYTNTSHFIRQFSDRTGLTPSDHRKKISSKG